MDYQEIFSKIFTDFKEKITKTYSKDDPDEISPNEKAILIGVSKLPCKIDILELIPNDISSSESYCIVKYNLEFLGKLNIIIHNSIQFKKDELKNALHQYFDESDESSEFISEQIIKDNQILGFPQETSFIQFLNYDLKTNFDKFMDHTFSPFYSTFLDYFVQKFNTDKIIDFNQLYELIPKKVIPVSEYLKPDWRGNDYSIEDLQEQMNNLLLIPNVPDVVKSMFQIAKDLYVLAFFNYQLFTVASHYCLLTFDSALEHRFIVDLGKKAQLQFLNENHEFTDPTYSQIFRFLQNQKHTKKWNLNKVTVNGKKFPMSSNQLVKYLIDNKIILKWQGNMFQELKKLRNSMTHVESSSTYPPNMAYGELRQLCHWINFLFHNLNDKSI